MGTARKTSEQGLSGRKIIRSAELEKHHTYKLRGPQHPTDPLGNGIILVKRKKIVNACFASVRRRIAGCLRQESHASRINGELQERACAREKL